MSNNNYSNYAAPGANVGIQANVIHGAAIEFCAKCSKPKDLGTKCKDCGR